MTVKSPSKPGSRHGISGLATLVVAVVIAAIFAHHLPGAGGQTSPKPSASACPTNNSGSTLTVRAQAKHVNNPATPDKPHTFVLLGRWSNTALGVDIKWVTDGTAKPPPGKFPYRSGTNTEEVRSRGGRVGLVVTPIYPTSGNCGYIECRILPESDHEGTSPEPLVENISRQPNTGVSCFLEP